MKVEIWSDVVCPWCFVGKRSFEAALRAFDHADDVEVMWRSYELDPQGPRERSGSYIDRIARKYGVSPEVARGRMTRIVGIGADLGIDFRFDDLRAGNTFDAHRLLHMAATRSRQQELKERLFLATFTEGRLIGDPETLVALAGEVGIEAADARNVLDTRDYADEVRQDEAEAMELGVTGVPFFVFDRRFAVGGAQSSDVFLNVLERAWGQLAGRT